MICLECEGEEFIKDNVQVEQDYKGKKYNFITEAMVCVNCGFIQFDDNQANELKKGLKHEI